MKRQILLVAATATLCAWLTPTLAAQEMPPGQVDFGTFSPPKDGGEFVEVNVSPNLIWLASRLVEKDEPEVAQMLTGLKLVRVNVIALSDENRGELQTRAQKINKDLAAKGWERVVAAQQKDQDVSVYLKTGSGGTVQGVAAVIFDNKQHAVFINVVGDIKPEQIAMLGDKLQIDPLKKLGLGGANSEKKHKAKDAEKSEN